MEKEITNFRELFKIRADEFDAKRRLADLRFSSDLEEATRVAESSVAGNARQAIERLTNSISYSAEIYNDLFWLTALNRMGLIPNLVMKIWDEKENLTRELLNQDAQESADPPQ